VGPLVGLTGFLLNVWLFKYTITDVNLIHIGQSPSYLADLVTATADIPSRADKGLRSA